MRSRPQTMVEALAGRWTEHVNRAPDHELGSDNDARWWMKAVADEMAHRFTPCFLPTVHPAVRGAIAEHHRETVALLRREAARNPHDSNDLREP